MPWAFLFGLGIFLAAGATAAGIGGLLARRHPEARHSLEIAALACAAIVGIVFLFQNVLAHDALWHYGHLRSAIVDHDLDLYDELVLHNPHAMTVPSPSAPIAPLGTAIVSAPAALAARPIAALRAREGVVPGWDGYAPLETAAVTWTALLAALGGVALTFRCARSVASGGACAVATATLLYASPLVFLTFVWPGHPQAASVLAGAAFLCVWTREERQDAGWTALLLGLLGGVLALVEPRDAVYLALPALDVVVRATRSRRFVPAIRSCALLAAGALVGFAPQALAWLAMGRGEPLLLLHRGPASSAAVLTWSPIYVLGVAGIFLLRRSHPRWFHGLFLLVALQWIAAGTLLGAWPALGLGLAVAVDRMARRVGFFAASLATVPFVYWNLLLTAQIRLGWLGHGLPADLATTLARQLHEAPQFLVRGLCGNVGWNRVMLIEQLRSALEGGSLRAALTWLATLALAATVVTLWMKLLASERVGPPRTSARPALLLATACAISAWGAASVARDHDRTRLVADAEGTPLLLPPGAVRALSFVPPGPAPSAGLPAAIAWRAEAGGGGPARLRLDVVSFLRHAEHLEEGALVALVDLHGPGCPEVSMTVRAGFESAETAPELALHASLASWRIAPGCRPDTVLVRVDPDSADLEIRRLSVALVRDGLGFAPEK